MDVKIDSLRFKPENLQLTFYMVGTLFFLLYTFFCSCADKRWIICSLILLFPSHATIRTLLLNYYGNIGLFPFWYDVGIFMLLFKVRECFKRMQFKPILIILCSVVTLYFIVPSMYGLHDDEALTTLRVYIHCFALFLIFSTINIKQEEKIFIFKSIVISAIVYSISAIVIHFVFQEQWHNMLGHYIKTINGLEYTSSSFTILGLQRLYGFLPGPNQYGVYFSIVILLLLFTKGLLNRTWVLIALFPSVISIFLSFSRAGWGILLGTIIVNIILEQKLKILLKISSIILFVFVVGIYVLVNFSPDSWDIILSTLNGDESSSATRSSNVTEGLSLILKNPLGWGLGSGVNSIGTPIAESSLVICLFEIGIFGTVLIYGTLLYFALKIYNKGHRYSVVISSFVIVSLVVSYASMNVFQYPFFYYMWSIVGLGLNNSEKYIKRKLVYVKVNNHNSNI